MLTPDNVKVAVVLMLRAPCTGEEAKNVALAIDAFTAMHNQMTAPLPPVEADDANDEEVIEK